MMSQRLNITEGSRCFKESKQIPIFFKISEMVILIISVQCNLTFASDQIRWNHQNQIEATGHFFWRFDNLAWNDNLRNENLWMRTCGTTFWQNTPRRLLSLRYDASINIGSSLLREWRQGSDNGTQLSGSGKWRKYLWKSKLQYLWKSKQYWLLLQ